MELSEAYKDLLNQIVVVDVAPPIVYIGTLQKADKHFLTLCDVDVHELQSSATTKEVYVIEIKRNGLFPNREQVMIKQDEVLSLSRLEDIILY